MSYVNANRLVGLTNGNFNLRYDYEPNSHLVKTLTFRNTNATRMTTSKTYDKVNRLLGISSTASGLLLPESYAYDYNKASQRTRMTLADGSAWNYGYDSLGQVTTGKKNWADGSAVPGQQFEYGYDDIGNRIFAREGGDNNGNGLRRSGYSVDLVNQYSSRTNAGGFDMIGIANALASVTVNNQSTYRKGEYFHKELSVNNAGGAQYQQITNIASIPAGGGSLVSSEGGQVYVPPATETFTHDMDGNLTQNGRWNLAWDAENRLINVAARDGSETATNVAFQYDNLWRRIYKKVSLGSGTHTTNRFAYDGWNLVAEFDGATNILKSYMWGKDLSGSLSGAGGVGGLTSMTIHSGAHSGTYFYAYDGNGNVTALINATNGAVSARYEYDPFHNLTRATGPLAKLNNFLAATKYYDWETGFSYYGYRYYEPDTGRWLSRDTIGEGGGMNLFGFVSNDPENHTDFAGLNINTVNVVSRASCDLCSGPKFGGEFTELTDTRFHFWNSYMTQQNSVSPTVGGIPVTTVYLPGSSSHQIGGNMKIKAICPTPINHYTLSGFDVVDWGEITDQNKSPKIKCVYTCNLRPTTEYASGSGTYLPKGPGEP